MTAVSFSGSSCPEPITPPPLSKSQTAPGDYCTSVHVQTFYTIDTCEPFTVTFRCFREAPETYQINDGPQQTGTFDMSNAQAAVPTTASTTVKGQFMARLIASGANIVGTIDSELVAAAIAEPTTATVDGKTYTFTADDVCAWSVKGLPCEATYLATPGDPTTATNPTVDGTFVNDLMVRADQDEEKGGVDVTTSLLVQDGAVADVCVFFEKELSKTELAAL